MSKKSITIELSFLKKKFFIVTDFLHSKGLSDELIHLVHLAILARNFTVAGQAMGNGRETFSHTIANVYNVFEIDEAAKSKFITLVKLIYREVIKYKIGKKLYKPKFNPAHKIQILLAMELEERALYVIKVNLEKLFPEEHDNRIKLIGESMQNLSKI